MGSASRSDSPMISWSAPAGQGAAPISVGINLLWSRRHEAHKHRAFLCDTRRSNGPKKWPRDGRKTVSSADDTTATAASDSARSGADHPLSGPMLGRAPDARTLLSPERPRSARGSGARPLRPESDGPTITLQSAALCYKRALRHLYGLTRDCARKYDHAIKAIDFCPTPSLRFERSRQLGSDPSSAYQ